MGSTAGMVNYKIVLPPLMFIGRSYWVPTGPLPKAGPRTLLVPSQSWQGLCFGVPSGPFVEAREVENWPCLGGRRLPRQYSQDIEMMADSSFLMIRPEKTNK